jgi:hypothetical protein
MCGHVLLILCIKHQARLLNQILVLQREVGQRDRDSWLARLELGIGFHVRCPRSCRRSGQGISVMGKKLRELDNR